MRQPLSGHAAQGLDALAVALVWLGMTLVLVVLVVGCSLLLRRAWRHRRDRALARTHEERIHAFTDAVASGDFSAADAFAAELLGGNETRPARWLACGPMSHVGHSRGSCLGSSHPAESAAVTGFDVRTVLSCTADEAAISIGNPELRDVWFGVRRNSDGESLTFAFDGDRDLMLVAVTEEWSRQKRALLVQAVTPGGVWVRSHLTIRTVVASGPRGLRQGVEVWLHLEAPDSRVGCGVMTRLESIARRGIRQLEAEFDG